jgi:hypothetical protein
MLCQLATCIWPAKVRSFARGSLTGEGGAPPGGGARKSARRSFICTSGAIAKVCRTSGRRHHWQRWACYRSVTDRAAGAQYRFLYARPRTIGFGPSNTSGLILRRRGRQGWISSCGSIHIVDRTSRRTPPIRLLAREIYAEDGRDDIRTRGQQGFRGYYAIVSATRYSTCPIATHTERVRFRISSSQT